MQQREVPDAWPIVTRHALSYVHRT